MANTIFQLRRSSVAGKQPTTSDVAIGELAINLSDKKIYSSNGTAIFEPAANVTNLYVGNSSVSATVNSTVYTGTANNSTYLNGQLASYYTNATNITSGTLPYAQIPANVINTTSSFTITGVHTHNANIVIGTTAGISANGTYGSDGQYLTSNGSALYWSTSTGAPTYVRQNFTGDGTTTSFTISGGYTANNIDVYLNGVKQRNGTDVTVSSGTAVVFAIAPANGALIDAIGSIATLSPAGVNTDSSYIWTNTHTYGNSTVNTTVNSSLIAIGNSSVNTQIVAGNVYLNGSTLVIGNSTVNSVSNGSVSSTSSGNSTVFVSRKHYVLDGTTNNAIEGELYISGLNRIPFPENTTIYYNIDVVGRSNNSSDSASFHIKGLSESRSGVIASVNLSNVSSGYIVKPTVTVTDATGSSANIVASIANGKVSALTIKNSGFNYTSPTITISNPTASNGSFNSNTSITTTNNTITITPVSFGTYYKVNDPLKYFVNVGSTVLSGFTNNGIYYIKSISTSKTATIISLSDTIGGATKTLVKGLTQTHYFAPVTATATATVAASGRVDIGELVETIVTRTDSSWYIDARANNSTNSLNIYVKGATGKNIIWSATVNTIEVYST